MLGITVNEGRFEFGSKIASGSFGSIYYGLDKKENKDAAIKIEPATNKIKQLEYEARLYRVLGSATGIPLMHWFGTEQMSNIMVMDLLGPSLQDLFSFVGHQFSLKTVLQFGTQTLNILEYVHSKSFLHRDLKPANILVGRGLNISQIHIIDWGLAKRFRKRDVHIQLGQKESRGLIGNARFASLNAHTGMELSRRDDMEPLCYMLIYFMKGKLPWQTLDPPAETREERNKRIGLMKKDIKIEFLCAGLPAALVTLLTLTKCLEFEECPNYELFRKILKLTAEKESLIFDGEFDWTHRRAEGEEVDVASEDGRSCNMSQVSFESVPAPDEVPGVTAGKVLNEAGPLMRAATLPSDDGGKLARALQTAGVTAGPVWDTVNRSSITQKEKDGDPVQVRSSLPNS